MSGKSLAVFEGKEIRRHYDEDTGTWFFSVVDIVQVLIQQPDYQTARKYWNKLKERLKREGSESVTKCHRLKLEAADGKLRLTDTASPDGAACWRSDAVVRKFRISTDGNEESSCAVCWSAIY